jgi:hypothetical protein
MRILGLGPSVRSFAVGVDTLLNYHENKNAMDDKQCL